MILCIALACFAMATCKNASNDLFWQLRVGADILATHAVPRTDHYSWTRAGQPWVVHEWLFFAAEAAAYRAFGGFAGVWLWEAALATAIVTTLFLLVLRETGRLPLPAFLLTLLAVVAMQPLLQPRPQLITYWFLLIVTSVMIGITRDGRIRRRHWLLAPLCVIWANLHAGVVVGLALMAAFTAGLTLEARLGRRGKTRTPTAAMAGLTVLSALATLVNPYGPRLYADFTATLNNQTALNLVGEWQTPDYHDAFGLTLEALFALFLVAAIAAPREVGWTRGAIVLGLAHTAIGAGRNVPLLVLIGTPLMAESITVALRRGIALTTSDTESATVSLFGSEPSTTMVALVGLCFASLSAVSAVKTVGLARSGFGTLERFARAGYLVDSFPDDACWFLQREDAPAGLRLYNIYDDGGYLIWRMPERKVFIDGRADVYFGGVLDDCDALMRIPYRWRAILGRYQPDIGLMKSDSPQTRLFLGAREWTLVYVSDPTMPTHHPPAAPPCSLIFLRRAPNNGGLIARCRRDCPALRAPQFTSVYGIEPSTR